MITHRFLRLHVTERRHLIINRVGFAKIMMTLKLLILCAANLFGKRFFQIFLTI